ncbi:Thermostable beta-glucosidase B [Sedimentisphaera salicampi]|uniref:Thermostable beta-glucosidase B n=1 Tax=Sedimentisphaera salicampi TaxID=1941349 RepID=A0A1W6LKB3_9BACT|nr:Thermostable beta-glucosidase B [Sedimentisphaera salicampi]
MGWLWKLLLLIALALAINSSMASASLHREETVEKLLKKMTLEEKVSLCHGASRFTTASVERLGIRSLEVVNGPHGVGIRYRDRKHLPNRDEAHTYFPTGISVGATWNRELIRDYGKALGTETGASGRDVILGGAININRNPLCGRFFEYMSEDPYHISELIVPYIKGVQSTGVATCVKHFVANSQERQRFSIDENVDLRTLHEIYFPGFKASVQEGNVLTVMSAYNKLNGTYCSENGFIQTDILKERWGFDGLVMSDWGAVHSVNAAEGGLDLEMPGNDNNYLGEPLLEGCRNGEIPESRVDDMVRRMLRLHYEIGALKESPKRQRPKLDKKANEKIALETAREAIVLLKNSPAALPLDKKGLDSIFITGINADQTHSEGGGSSAIHCDYEITPLEGMRMACEESNTELLYKPYSGKQELKPIPAKNLLTSKSSNQNGLIGHYYDNKNFDGSHAEVQIDSQVNFNWTGKSPAKKLPKTNFSVRWTGAVRVDETGDYIFGLNSDDGSRLFIDGELVVDNWGNHGAQLETDKYRLEKDKTCEIKIEYYNGLKDSVVELLWRKEMNHNKIFKEDARMASRCGAAVVFAGLSHEYDREGKDKPDMKLPGRQAEQIKAITEANSNTIVVMVGGSPVEMGGFLEDVPSVIQAWYAGQRGGEAIADIIFGKVNPSGKLPVTLPKRLEDTPAFAIGEYPGENGEVEHKEGIFVGYRYYDTMDVEPEFAFGHGLSYTNFEYSDLKITSEEPFTANVSLTVKNTGKRMGKETVQIYIHDKKSSLKRPVKELKGFEKISLNKGQAKTVQFTLSKEDFSFFNPELDCWIAEPGEFVIMAGSSSKDIRLEGSLEF